MVVSVGFCSTSALLQNCHHGGASGLDPNQPMIFSSMERNILSTDSAFFFYINNFISLKLFFKKQFWIFCKEGRFLKKGTFGTTPISGGPGGREGATMVPIWGVNYFWGGWIGVLKIQKLSFKTQRKIKPFWNKFRAMHMKILFFKALFWYEWCLELGLGCEHLSSAF